jgi:hypothetical protein
MDDHNLYPIMFQYSNDIPQWLVKSHIPLYVLTMAHGETSNPWSNYGTLDRRRIAFLAQTLIRFSGLWSEALDTAKLRGSLESDGGGVMMVMVMVMTRTTLL